MLILDVYAKKTAKIPDEVIERCQQRLKLLRFDRQDYAKEVEEKVMDWNGR